MDAGAGEEEPREEEKRREGAMGHKNEHGVPRPTKQPDEQSLVLICEQVEDQN